MRVFMHCEGCAKKVRACLKGFPKTRVETRSSDGKEKKEGNGKEEAQPEAGAAAETEDTQVIQDLGMKDSWGSLKPLSVASAVNGIGEVVLCTFLGYGIAGAAWATMASQVIAAYMMVEALNKKGYNGYLLSVPSFNDLKHIYSLAAPVFVTMISKVTFYALLVYFATSLGIQTVAAHQDRGCILVTSSPEILTRVKKCIAWKVCKSLLKPSEVENVHTKKDYILENQLLHDEKQCIEDIMLVDLGRNVVGKVEAPS